MIAAFRGWNDAGEAASFGAAHLERVWEAKAVASIDPEEFYDFQANRPTVHLVDGITREITWPTNIFSAAHLPGAHHDVLLLRGNEPSTRWRTYSGLITDLAVRYDVQLVITLGALLADVPHSRDIQITGTAVDQELIERLDLRRSRYEGPTGIVGVLHDALGRARVPSASLWAAVPHYLAVSPNPKAALALVNKAAALVGADADVGMLESAAASYDARVDEMVAEDEDIKAYVHLLEERADGRAEDSMDQIELPSGDAIAAELERFLQERREGEFD